MIKTTEGTYQVPVGVGEAAFICSWHKGVLVDPWHAAP